MTPTEAYVYVGKAVWTLNRALEPRERKILAASPKSSKAWVGPLDPTQRNIDRTVKEIPVKFLFKSREQLDKFIEALKAKKQVDTSRDQG